MKKVMVFGTFDGVHAGHRAFLREARKCGDHLTVVVARDNIVRTLKGRFPNIGFRNRCESLRKEQGVDKAVGSDTEIGAWEILQRHNPDVIALGYDQTLLKESLQTYLRRVGRNPEIRVIGFHELKDSLS